MQDRIGRAQGDFWAQRKALMEKSWARALRGKWSQRQQRSGHSSREIATPSRGHTQRNKVVWKSSFDLAF